MQPAQVCTLLAESAEQRRGNSALAARWVLQPVLFCRFLLSRRFGHCHVFSVGSPPSLLLLLLSLSLSLHVLALPSLLSSRVLRMGSHMAYSFARTTECGTVCRQGDACACMSLSAFRSLLSLSLLPCSFSPLLEWHPCPPFAALPPCLR